MSPERQPAQWGKIVEVDGFILAVMGKQKKKKKRTSWSLSGAGF